MSRIGFVFRSVACAVLVSAVAAVAQQSAATQAGPIPPAIQAAKKIFVSNSGADSSLYAGGFRPYSGDQNRSYNQFFAALKTTGQFEMSSDPSDADLVLELGITDLGSQGSAFRLVIFDRKSHYVLWTLSSWISPGNPLKNRDRNFDDALNSLIREFQAITGKVPAAAH